ncbi:MAG: hypothetical protein RLZZ450_1091 [Pseudomonadota bacterium]|jgi:hypothetical protein
MNSSTRLALLLGLQLAAGAAFVACGSDPADDSEDNPGKGADAGDKPTGSTDPVNGQLGILSSPLYSAFVEGHEAQVPVVLKDAARRGKGAKFTSSDPSIAVVSDSADGATVTIKKEGSVTITGKLDGDSGSTKLTIKKYTEEQWKQGQARYSKSDLAIVPAPGTTSITLLALANGGSLNKTGACNTCHTSQAKTLKIENTPLQIAGYSDDDLVTIFTMGKKPDGAAVKTMIPPFAWGMFHSWTVTDDEKPGLIAYLRTQALKANPPTIDYGVKPCPGEPTTITNGMIPKLCDNDGNPVTIPGLPGAAGGSDAGTPSTSTGSDAGKPATSGSDAGVAATSDAG